VVYGRGLRNYSLRFWVRVGLEREVVGEEAFLSPPRHGVLVESRPRLVEGSGCEV
jgi:hypothetical protein